MISDVPSSRLLRETLLVKTKGHWGLYECVSKYNIHSLGVYAYADLHECCHKIAKKPIPRFSDWMIACLYVIWTSTLDTPVAEC